MKVVINKCYGGYGLSKKAYEYLGIDWGNKEDYFIRGGNAYWDDRSNPKLVECVETLKGEANTMLSHLVVVEIPDDVDWYIDSKDGMETIHEKHRMW